MFIFSQSIKLIQKARDFPLIFATLQHIFNDPYSLLKAPGSSFDKLVFSLDSFLF